MKKLLILLLLSATPAMAQFTYPLQPAGGGTAFTGGAVTSQIRGATGCTTPAYSFTAGPTAGLCYIGGSEMDIQTPSASGSSRFVFHMSGTDAGGDGIGFHSSAIDGTVNTSRVDQNDESFTIDFASGSARLVKPTFVLNANVVSTTFLSFTNVAAPANIITLAQDSSVPSLTTTVTNGAGAYTLTTLLDASVGKHLFTLTDASGGGFYGVYDFEPYQVDLTISEGTGQGRFILSPGKPGYLNSWQITNTGIAVAMKLTLDGPVDVTQGTQPTCASGIRGNRWRTEGGAGVADTYEVCTKDAADVYAWRSLLP